MGQGFEKGLLPGQVVNVLQGNTQQYSRTGCKTTLAPSTCLRISFYFIMAIEARLKGLSCSAAAMDFSQSELVDQLLLMCKAQALCTTEDTALDW